MLLCCRFEDLSLINTHLHSADICYFKDFWLYQQQIIKQMEQIKKNEQVGFVKRVIGVSRDLDRSYILNCLWSLTGLFTSQMLGCGMQM